MTKEENIKLIPELKSVFQKIVLFIPSGLFFSHSVLNLFGPTPKTGLSLSVFPAISNVDCQDGLTSN